jgi:hypothetical protein
MAKVLRDPVPMRLRTDGETPAWLQQSPLQVL